MAEETVEQKLEWIKDELGMIEHRVNELTIGVLMIACSMGPPQSVEELRIAANILLKRIRGQE